MSRRKNRYNNRQKVREEKKERIRVYDNFENVASLKSLYNAAKKASSGVSWKTSVQRYMLSRLFKIQKTRRELLKGKDIRKGFIEFDIHERGKVRHISSVHFYERVVQKSICKNVLYPILTNSIIHHNYASQKGKGTHFAENCFTKYLRSFLRKNNRDGYVLMIDFKGYFESIAHEPLKLNIKEHIFNNQILNLSDGFIDAFGERGLGLGSETSQINAIFHINKIDHYIKEVERIKYYGRYMDDSYIIHKDKEFLKQLLARLEKEYAKYGVKINKNKTKIISLKKPFTFLKTRFFITQTCKVIKKPTRNSITIERRKLKKQFGLLKNNVLTLKEIDNSYQSWRGSLKHRNSRKTIYSMDKLYKKLFEEVQNGKDRQ